MFTNKIDIASGLLSVSSWRPQHSCHGCKVRHLRSRYLCVNFIDWNIDKGNFLKTRVSKEETQVSKEESQISKEETQVSKAETQVSKEETQVSKKETQVSKET